MRELQRTDRLTIATIAFLLVIIIGFITMRSPELNYSRDFSSSARDSQNPESRITPDEVNQILKLENPSVLFVDIRSIYDFNKEHVKNALHIPKTDLLSEENIERFTNALEDDMTIILYGKDQLDATGPGMLLRDIGFNNIRVMMGGYDYLANPEIQAIGKIPGYQKEIPRYNYAEMISSPQVSEPASPKAGTPEVIVPVRKAKAKAEGGC